MRQLAKRAVESLLGGENRTRARLRQLRGVRFVLAYHNVVATHLPPVGGDQSLHLPLHRFREQLDVLAALGIPVVAVDAPLAPDATPTAAITFDDAYAGVCEHAIPELQRRGIPATIFVTPGLLGARAPWWDCLASPELGAVPASMRAQALWESRGEGEAILAHARTSGWPLHTPLPVHRIASEEELTAAMATAPLLSLGVHTWSHPNLAALDKETIASELSRTASWLRERFPTRWIPEVAYPYGLFTELASSVAAEVGLRAGWRVEGGGCTAQDAPFARPRLNITPGLSAAGFRMRLTIG